MNRTRDLIDRWRRRAASVGWEDHRWVLHACADELLLLLKPTGSSQDRRDRIVALRGDGQSARAIGQQFGVGPARVLQIIREERRRRGVR